VSHRDIETVFCETDLGMNTDICNDLRLFSANCVTWHGYCVYSSMTKTLTPITENISLPPHGVNAPLPLLESLVRCGGLFMEML